MSVKRFRADDSGFDVVEQLEPMGESFGRIQQALFYHFPVVIDTQLITTPVGSGDADGTVHRGHFHHALQLVGLFEHLNVGRFRGQRPVPVIMIVMVPAAAVHLQRFLVKTKISLSFVGQVHAHFQILTSTLVQA